MKTKTINIYSKYFIKLIALLRKSNVYIAHKNSFLFSYEKTKLQVN